MILTTFLPFGAVGNTIWEADRGFYSPFPPLLPPAFFPHTRMLIGSGGIWQVAGAALVGQQRYMCR